MKIRKYEDITFVGAGTTFSDPIEISPRYSRVEFSSQALSGSNSYDLEVQGIETGQLLEFQGEHWLESAPSTNENDWMTILEADSVIAAKAANLGNRPASFSFYRAKVTTTQAATVRFTVVAIRE